MYIYLANQLLEYKRLNLYVEIPNSSYNLSKSHCTETDTLKQWFSNNWNQNTATPQLQTQDLILLIYKSNTIKTDKVGRWISKTRNSNVNQNKNYNFRLNSLMLSMVAEKKKLINQ